MWNPVLWFLHLLEPPAIFHLSSKFSLKKLKKRTDIKWIPSTYQYNETKMHLLVYNISRSEVPTTYYYVHRICRIPNWLNYWYKSSRNLFIFHLQLVITKTTTKWRKDAVKLWCDTFINRIWESYLKKRTRIIKISNGKVQNKWIKISK